MVIRPLGIQARRILCKAVQSVVGCLGTNVTMDELMGVRFCKNLAMDKKRAYCRTYKKVLRLTQSFQR